MGSPALDVSPLASSLLELSARKATGRLVVGGRTLELSGGLTANVRPAAQDESLAQFLVKSGRAAAGAVAECEQGADSEHILGERLIKRAVLSEAELRQARRSLYVDRLARGLRLNSERGEQAPPFVASERAPAQVAALPLVPILLDALARAAASANVGAISAHLNHRIAWEKSVHGQAARNWADFGDTLERPAVSTVLAKRPAAAPRIAALLRAGLLRLDQPGRSVPSQPPPAGSLPPPAPRVAAMPALAGTARAQAPDPLAKLASNRPPRLRLDPGQELSSADPLEATRLPQLPEPSLALGDPLLSIEQRIAELEARDAPGPERARAFCQLADVWRSQFGSIERACRAFREAAAADPRDSGVLRQAALHCHYLGQAELASRYVMGAVLVAGLPADRAAAQRLRAVIERALGHTDTCIEALCEAAADDPDSTEPHEQVAALLLESGNVEGANAHMRLAAATHEDDTHERALALLAWAWSAKPSDAPTAYEYASMLDAGGRRLGAAAIFAETARRTGDRDQARKLRLVAAERAEAAQRLDLAAELLLDAFDAEPHLDLLYGPLDEDLTELGFPEFRVVVLEDVATACADRDRAHWLARAGRASLEADGQHEASIWLFLEALLTEPGKPEALELLREHARSDRELTLLAHGLRAAIAASIEHDQTHAKALLWELAVLAEERLSALHLALAACQQLERLSHDRDPDVERAITRLSARTNAQAGSLEAAERALQQAHESQRHESACRVAELLPDLPEHWPRKIQLLNAAVAAGAAGADARATLETLLGLNRDAVALATFLQEQAELSEDRGERVRLLSRLAAVHTVREDAAAVAAACESLLSIDQASSIAIARLLRAARKLGDARRLVRAHTLRVQFLEQHGAGDRRARARALAQLARAEEHAGMLDQAAEHAVEAVRHDEHAADAGLLLLRHSRRVEPAAAHAALSALRNAIGGSRTLLANLTHMAQAAEDEAAQRELIETRVALLPSDPAAHRARLLLLAQGNEPKPLLDAALIALTLIPSVEVLDASHAALDRLELLGEHAAACTLALRIAEEQGRPDPELARRALTAAEKSRLPELMTSARELACAVAPLSERESALLELAAHHRARRAHAAEVRALLRVLEGENHQRVALERLRELFASGDDATRLLATVTLQLDAESAPPRRQELLLELATIAQLRQRDEESANHYIRMLVAEVVGDEAALRRALGTLLSLSEDPRHALERCQSIADACPPALASRIYLWCAITAEQRLGDPELALEVARAAALRWRSYGEPLLLMERLTLETKDAVNAMRGYDALIALASGPHGRRALLYRAGRWLERAELLDQALARYEQAFELAPTTGAAFRALSRVARQTGRLERIVPCYERLADQVREARMRFNLLSTAGELCLNELHDARRGLHLLLRANAISERFELDDRVLEASRGLALREPEVARGVLEDYTAQLSERAAQLWNQEDKVRCLLRLGNVSSEDLGRHAKALEAIDQALEIAQREELPGTITAGVEEARSAVLAREAKDLAIQPVAAELARSALPEPSAPESTPAAKPGVVLPVASSSASPAAVATATDPRAELRRAICAAPQRTDLLRALHQQPGASAAEQHVLHQLLASFDRSLPALADQAFSASYWPKGELAGVLAQPSELLELGAMLWDCARVIPHLRKPLAELGVSARDRISSITVGPVADAYVQAVRLLERSDVPVYIMLENDAAPRALATHPPIVLVSRGVEVDQSTLLFRMAHALWLAAPEYIVGGVLAPDVGSELVLSSQLAFGSTSDERAAASSVKALAKTLWQSVPMREQRRLADAVRGCGIQLSYASLRACCRASAARAALLVSGGLRAALTALPQLEPELAGVDLREEAEFARACERSAAFAETIRCVLSTPYLDTLTRALDAALRRGERVA
jgi:hypothetical protein